MVLLEFSMTPASKEESKSPYVARILDVIDRSGLSYQLTPMGTIIEGDWAEVMAVVTDCFKALEGDCPRISSQIKIDYRAGTNQRKSLQIFTRKCQTGTSLSEDYFSSRHMNDANFMPAGFCRAFRGQNSGYGAVN